MIFFQNSWDAEQTTAREIQGSLVVQKPREAGLPKIGGIERRNKHSQHRWRLHCDFRGHRIGVRDPDLRVLLLSKQARDQAGSHGREVQASRGDAQCQTFEVQHASGSCSKSSDRVQSETEILNLLQFSQ